MANKKKGQLTTSSEWAKHLRKYLKNQFWKGERNASKKLIQADIDESQSIDQTMNARIESILNSTALDSSVTGFPTFQLAALNLPEHLNFALPTNMRLGHLAEKVVSACIQASSNYNLLFENIQLKEDKRTIGELDFILQHKESKEVAHLELAYKFYLYDPTLSENPMQNWIGPNRNDALHNKLEKLKNKQFPLLHHPATAKALTGIDLNSISQKLCLIASLFVPYQFKESFSPTIEKAICGYYTDFKTFEKLHRPSKTYCIPLKKEWGIKPTAHENWVDFAAIEKHIRESLNEKQAVLYWVNDNGAFSSNFIVWW